MALTLSPSGSHVRVRTFAEGMLARLAHDLELEWPVAEGHADLASGEASVRIDADAVTVLGAKKGRHVDLGALSVSDREEIKRRLLGSIGADRGNGVIVANIKIASGRSKVAKVEIALACGRATTDADVEMSEHDGTTRVTGSLTLSLRALGVPEIKGPLGAFRLKDRIELAFAAELR